MTQLEKAKHLLFDGEFTCVMLTASNTTVTSHQRGVKPLLEWIDSGVDGKHAVAADKVVGKATAFLYVKLGVDAVYARVISRPALAVLGANGIQAEYDTLAEHIINRAGDDICPFEKEVLGVDDPEQAFVAIRRKAENRI